MAGAFRAVEATIEQDWAALSAWLEARGRELDSSDPPRQFSGGSANLNYLLTIDGTPVVLRRPPAGPMAEGASDMAREWRVLSALPTQFPLAPRGLLFCDDVTVLGAAFQLIEYRPGVVIGPTLPPEMQDRADVPDCLVDGLVQTMAALHAVDADRVGLGTLGRPEGFLGRQVEGWARRAEAAYETVPASLPKIVDWLRVNLPADGPAAILHSDLKLDNMLIDPQTAQPTAVIDWDMATRGDPLFDLGVLLSYWTDPDDPAAMHTIAQVPSLEPGFPTRGEVAQRYFAAAGRTPTSVGFHITLARMRLAIAWQQLYRLYQRGALTDPRFDAFAGTADAVLDWTADTLNAPPV